MKLNLKDIGRLNNFFKKKGSIKTKFLDQWL